MAQNDRLGRKLGTLGKRVERLSMSNKGGGSISSPSRSWLLATCAFGFALVLWNTFATPRYRGYTGVDWAGTEAVSTVLYVAPGFPGARAGLRAGDKFEFPRNTISQGVRYVRALVGQPIPTRVQRGGRVFYTSIVPVAQPVRLRGWLDNLGNWWSTIFASVVAWFGVGRRARLLAWLLILGAISGNGLEGFLGPWPWLNEAALLLNVPVSVLAVALVATISSTFGRPIGPLRRALELATYAAALVGGAAFLLFNLVLVTPWFDWASPLVNFDYRFGASAGTSLLLGAACALVAVATVRGEERQRAAWLLIPLAAINIIVAIAIVASGFAGGFYGGSQQLLSIVADLGLLVALVVMSYAVLSRRLLDVEFVINRAAVFGGVSLVVVGVFVLVEFLFNKFFAAASRTTSIAVIVGIALAVGVSLQYIHHYVDKLVDLVFFRARHEHEHALRTFAHEAAFITDSDTLLDNAVHEVAVHAETDPVSILLRDERGSFRTARSSNGAIDTVSENDRAILKLRAWHSPIDLDAVDTAIAGSRAYPLISRGDLLGVLVCGGKRDGQAYAPDESEALFLLARSVGSALDGLRREGRDELKAALDDLRDDLTTRIAEIGDALRDLTPSTDGRLPISTVRPPTGV